MIEATIQGIMLLGYASFEAKYRLPDHVRHAVWWIMHCRTAALGGHVQSCPEGHFERIWYNSCRHRSCPKCAYLGVERWLRRQKARLLACDHYHVIFTLPDALRPLWRLNPELMTRLLFATARETLLELLGDDKYLGAKPGVLAALHTWSKTLVLHPHLHCLVSGGGLNERGEWMAVKRNYLLPFRVVRDLFRGKMRAAIIKALEGGQIVLPEGMSTQRLCNLLNRLGQKKWNVYIREKYAHGTGVVLYLARYVRGGPISNGRILKVTDEQVTFNYGRGKVEKMPLSVEEFIRRYLQHVPIPNAVTVRSYGIYARSQSEALAKCRKALGQGSPEAIEKIDWENGFEGSEDHPRLCPVCGRRLIATTRFIPPGKPISSREDAPDEVYCSQAA